jgi:hypothetical protein
MAIRSNIGRKMRLSDACSRYFDKIWIIWLAFRFMAYIFIGNKVGTRFSTIPLEHTEGATIRSFQPFWLTRK